tara:strand:+ start:6044 stop:6619 length:576 start_codon:yes stop_codon:yes gene_type:complete
MSTLKVDNLLLADKNKGTGRILEMFGGVCNGQTFDVLSGSYTLENVTGHTSLTTSNADVTGSTITYTPPEGTKTVIYNFVFTVSRGDNGAIAHFRLFLDSDEVQYARLTSGANIQYGQLVNYTWSFRCDASSDDAGNTGSVTSWTTPKTIKLQAREYGSNNEAVLHNNYYWNGSSGQLIFHMPVLQITAVG